MSRRQFSLEHLERRIALSANPASFSSSAELPSVVDSSYVSSLSRSIRASDNTTNTARDLGAIDRPISIRNQFVGTFDERDVFRFEMSRSGTATIHLNGLSEDADLYLLNTNRQTVATSKNSGSAADTITQELAAGEYFVVVQNYNRWRSTGYSLHLSAEYESRPDPVGNTLDTALELGSLRGTRTYQDFVGRDDGIDVFEFEVNAATRFEASLTGLSEDVDLYLLAENGQQLIKSDRSGTADEGFVGWIAPGSYFVAVDAYDSASSDYTLTLKTNLPSTPSRPPRNDAPTRPAPTPIPTTPPATEAPATLSPPATTRPQTPTPSEPVSSGPLADVPFFGNNTRDWGLNSVNAPEAWSAGYTGQGITVAVIDTGVQLNHADLTHSIWVNTDEIAGDGIDNDRNGFVDDVNGWDFIDNDSQANDGNGHGTHVAGIIAAANNSVGGTGVAYASSIMPIRVLDDNGSGSTNGVARGIRYAVDNGAQIINLSLGGGDSQSVYSALRYAQQNNVLVVAASGNESAGIPGHPASHSASLSNVISVGAYNSSGRIASFSNRVGSSGAVQIDAPGQSIFNTYIGNRYTSLSGTSMATPFVSGVAALAWAADPTLEANVLRGALTQSVGASINGSDSLGRLNAATAIPLALSGNVTVSNATSSNVRTNVTRSTASQRVWATIAGTESEELRNLELHENSEDEEVATEDRIGSQVEQIVGVQVDASADATLASASEALATEIAQDINESSVDEAFANDEFDAFRTETAVA